MDPTAAAPGSDALKASKYVGLSDLYVADFAVGAIFLFKNGTYEPDGSIRSGINAPWAITLDRAGNLYVVNRPYGGGGTITEYPAGASSPSFTYSNGITSPVSVSVDRHGNVFLTDVPSSGDDRVSEYPQGSNHPLYSCTVSNPWGVATDSSGDVFVDYNVANGGGYIDEFKGGLAGCSPTPLRVHVKHAFGMVTDRRDDILIADSGAKRIQIIAPPYATIARHINTPGRSPEYLALDKTDTNVFTSAYGYFRGHVFVFDYVNGQRELRVSGGGEIGMPYGIVDGPNDVN